MIQILKSTDPILLHDSDALTYARRDGTRQRSKSPRQNPTRTKQARRAKGFPNLDVLLDALRRQNYVASLPRSGRASQSEIALWATPRGHKAIR